MGDTETYFQRAAAALGARLLHEGVDGIYTFNWCAQPSFSFSLNLNSTTRRRCAHFAGRFRPSQKTSLLRARYSQTGVRAELLSDLAEVGALARRDKSYISTSIGEPRIDGECVACPANPLS